MAALCASDDVLLLTNGETAAVIHFSLAEEGLFLFRCPDEVQVLKLPEAPFTANRKPTPKRLRNVFQQSENKQDGGDGGQRLNEGLHNDRSETKNKILARAVSHNSQFIALCDDRKILHVFKAVDDKYTLHFSCGVSHRCTSVTLTRNNHVIIADKSGDAYDFDILEQERAWVTRNNKKDGAENGVASVESGTPSDGDEENTACGSLLLGHHSMLLDLLVIESEKLIVTCDRDEKIRISNYPDGYNISNFCLGHTEFVISLAYDEARKVLISGSGDATVRLWTLGGQELHQRNVLPDIPEEKQDSLQSMVANTTKETRQTAIQQICFSSETQVLFVALYKCPYVLLYKLSETEDSGLLALKLISFLSGEENFASMSIKKNVLVVLRQGTSKLNVSAYRVLCEDSTVQVVSVSEDSSPESILLRTLSSQVQLLEAPTSSSSLVPSLWKSRIQENFKFEANQKRQKERDQPAGRGKKQKKR